jgi:hypothetical protein
MKKVGWEIQPLGLLILIITAAALCYAMFRWVHRPSSASDKEA